MCFSVKSSVVVKNTVVLFFTNTVWLPVCVRLYTVLLFTIITAYTAVWLTMTHTAVFFCCVKNVTKNTLTGINLEFSCMVRS